MKKKRNTKRGPNRYSRPCPVNPGPTARRLAPHTARFEPNNLAETLLPRDSSPGAAIQSQIKTFESLNAAEVRALVDKCSAEAFVKYQTPLIAQAMRSMLNGREPHEQQVRAVRRLVFGLGDTILVARTGFGKSIVLHAYSVLTHNITLQIIPLSKLGDEQLEAISRYKGSSPCLVTALQHLCRLSNLANHLVNNLVGITYS